MSRDLSPEQAAAVHDTSRQTVIIAPPGSGKTHTLSARARATRDRHSAVPGTKALAVTFTNKSAKELTERTEGQAECGTFHSLALRLGRLYGQSPTVYDTVDSTDIACMVGEELGILTAGKYVKRGLAAAKVLKDAAGRRRYVAMLRQARAVDYDLLVADAVGYAKRPASAAHFSAHHLLVDEAQDTSPDLWEIVDALNPPATTVVLDPRQQIYAWRGGSAERGLQAWRDPAWSHRALVTNYRSAPAIVALGNKIARGMTFEAPEMVAMRPSNGAAVYPWSFDTSEAEATAVSEWAAAQAEGWESGAPRVFVLSRNWRGLARVREALTAASTPHAYLGDAGDFWQAEPIRMLVRAASLVLNPHQDPWTRMLAQWPMPRCSALDLAKAAEAAAREDAPLCHVLAARMPGDFGWMSARWQEDARKLPRALDVLNALDRETRAADAYALSGRVTKAAQVNELLARVTEWTATAEDASLSGFLDWLADGGATEDAPESPIHLSTVHGAKGLEAPAVAVVGLDEKGFRESGPEERRLAFVAFSRARDRLLLTRAEARHGEPVAPSSFWLEASVP